MAAISISLPISLPGIPSDSASASASPSPSASDGGGSSISPSVAPSNSNPGGSSASVSAPAGPASPSLPPSSSSAVVLSSASVSVGQSTVLSTSNGVVIVSTVKTTFTIPAGATITPSSHNLNAKSSSHTGAIAGGVVGGIALILVLGFGFWFLRKRAKEREEAELFDGNFDPARTTEPALPRVPGMGANGSNGVLDEDDGVGGRLAGSTIGGGVVTPFMAGVGTGAGGAPQSYYDQGHGHGAPQMQQYYGHDGTTTSGMSDSAQSPTTATSSNYYYQGPGGAAGAAAYPQSASSAGSSGGYPNRMSAKERDARGGNFTVANPTHVPMPGTSSEMPHLPNPHSPGSEVVVHTDGGRVPDQAEGDGMKEIPPTYESIRR